MPNEPIPKREFKSRDKVRFTHEVYSGEKFCKFCGEKAEFFKANGEGYYHTEVLTGVVSRIETNQGYDKDCTLVYANYNNGETIGCQNNDSKLEKIVEKKSLLVRILEAID